MEQNHDLSLSGTPFPQASSTVRKIPQRADSKFAQVDVSSSSCRSASLQTEVNYLSTDDLEEMRKQLSELFRGSSSGVSGSFSGDFGLPQPFSNDSNGDGKGRKSDFTDCGYSTIDKDEAEIASKWGKVNNVEITLEGIEPGNISLDFMPTESSLFGGINTLDTRPQINKSTNLGCSSQTSFKSESIPDTSSIPRLSEIAKVLKELPDYFSSDSFLQNFGSDHEKPLIGTSNLSQTNTADSTNNFKNEDVTLNGLEISELPASCMNKENSMFVIPSNSLKETAKDPTESYISDLIDSSASIPSISEIARMLKALPDDCSSSLLAEKLIEASPRVNSYSTPIPTGQEGNELLIQTTSNSLVWPCVHLNKSLARKCFIRNASKTHSEVIQLGIEDHLRSGAFMIFRNGTLLEELEISLKPLEHFELDIRYTPTSIGQTKGYVRIQRSSSNKQTKRIRLLAYGGKSSFNLINGVMNPWISVTLDESFSSCLTIENKGEGAMFFMIHTAATNLSFTPRVGCILPQRRMQLNISLKLNFNEINEVLSSSMNSTLKMNSALIIYGDEATRVRLKRLYKSNPTQHSRILDLLFQQDLPVDVVDVSHLKDPMNSVPSLYNADIRESHINIYANRSMLRSCLPDFTPDFFPVGDNTTFFAP